MLARAAVCAAADCVGTIDSMNLPPALPPPQGVRLLVIGDSHGHAGMLGRACTLAARIGAEQVWSVGDFGVWPGRGGRGFLDSVEYDAAAADVMVRVVPGNHDDYDQIDAALESVKGGWAQLRPHISVARRGHVETIFDTRILCMSGAASIDGPDGLWGPWRGPGDGWWPQERVSETDVEVACANIDAAGGRIDLAICHDLPNSAGVIGQADFLLGEQIRDRIRRSVEHGRTPLLLAGHWHRHLDRMVGDRREIVLSADVNPTQVQWAVVDITAGQRTPAVHLPDPWREHHALS